MCGHGTIGTVTIALEEGLIQPKNEGQLRLETPAGLVKIAYSKDGDKVTSVKLTNVKSFLAEEKIKINCPDLGQIMVDVSYGGNFYAIVDPQSNFNGIQDHTADQLISWSREIRKELNNHHSFVHPEDSTINGLSHLLWTGETLAPTSTARNAVFYGDKAIDRSPCGTGTSARMAQWHAQGKLKKGDEFIHESIIGSIFTGRIEEETTLLDRPAIIPSIEGWARIYGHNEIIIDDDDPYAHGFQVI
jgi:4-hydroxyproline epimerase